MGRISPKAAHPGWEADKRLTLGPPLTESLWGCGQGPTQHFPQPARMSPSPNILCSRTGRWAGNRRGGEGKRLQEGEASTHLPYLLEVQLGKRVQPVGQLAQVEKLHLEAGDKGVSHTGVWRRMSLQGLWSPGGKGGLGPCEGQQVHEQGRAVGGQAAWGPCSTDKSRTFETQKVHRNKQK